MDVHVSFKDRISGHTVVIRVAFGCSLLFKVGHETFTARNIVYTTPELNPRYFTMGHVVSLPDVNKKFSLPMREADTILTKLRTLSDIANVTHNLPPCIKQCRTRPSVLSLFQPVLISSTPSPKHSPELSPRLLPPHSGISITINSGQPVCSGPPVPSPIFTPSPPLQLVSPTSRPKTPLHQLNLTASEVDRVHAGDIKRAMTADHRNMQKSKQPPWVWKELKQREEVIRHLEALKVEAEDKNTELKKEVVAATDRAVREAANVERMRLNIKESQDVDDVLSPLRKSDAFRTKLVKKDTFRKAGTAVEEPSFVLMKTIRKLLSDEGDTGMVGISLDTIKRAIGPIAMQRELRKWAANGKAVKGGDNESSAKYADGINEAKAPEEVEKLEFYAKDWIPSRSVRQTIEDVSSWRSPKGLMWPTDTVTDLLGNLAVIERWHSANQTPGLVLPFYTYSLSLFNRVVWVAWVSSKQKACWEVLSHLTDDLEQAFSEFEGTQLTVNPAWFKNSKVGDVQPTLRAVPLNTKFEIDVFRQDKVVLVRYNNTSRGDEEIAPLHDTVLWLPCLKLGTSTLFASPLEQLPPPGLIEYLYSRSPKESLNWASNWVCKRVVGEKATELIKSCLNTVDQQKHDAYLAAQYTELIEKDSQLVPPPPKRDPKYPLIVDAIRMILKTKISEKTQMTPQHIAHALDIQKLVLYEKTYCINLASAPFLVVEVKPRSEPIEVFRLKNAFDDQIYWHINAAMRNYQFHNHDTILSVQTQSNDFDGKYTASNPPTSQEALELIYQKTKPVQFVRTTTPARKIYYHKKKWIARASGNNVTALKPEHCSYSIGIWMLQQVLPLQFYLDQALELLRAVPSPNPIPHEIVPPQQGIKNYRGLQGVILDRRVYDTNKIVLWGQFSSSSLDRGVAAAFAKGDSTAAVFTLLGRNCVCIAHWSRFARESEWLYPPNTIFRVTNSLAEEHQMILDKQNLQLFSMEEVDEFDAIETYLRGMVPLITGEGAPKYVMQLFNVIHYLSKKNTDESLRCLLDPYEQALYTPEGIRVAKRLMKLVVGHITALDANLIKAAEIGNSEGIGTLLELGASVEAINESRQTSLQVAASGGHLHAAKVLLNNNANVEANGGGFLALELAALRRDHALTDLLREKAPHLSDKVPVRLEEFQPRVVLPEPTVLKKAIEAAGLNWDRTRARHCCQSATVVLFDRGKNLFWLKFDNESTDLFPASVLIKDTSMLSFEGLEPIKLNTRRTSHSSGRRKSSRLSESSIRRPSMMSEGRRNSATPGKKKKKKKKKH